MLFCYEIQAKENSEITSFSLLFVFPIQPQLFLIGGCRRSSTSHNSSRKAFFLYIKQNKKLGILFHFNVQASLTLSHQCYSRAEKGLNNLSCCKKKLEENNLLDKIDTLQNAITLLIKRGYTIIILCTLNRSYLT